MSNYVWEKLSSLRGLAVRFESLHPKHVLPNHDLVSNIAAGTDGKIQRDSNIARSLGSIRIYDLSGHYRPHPGLFFHHRGCSAAER
jgi:hypothetical protein